MANPDNSVLKVRRSIFIAAPPLRVWEEFADHARMDRWWGAKIGDPVAGKPSGQYLMVYEPTVGGRIEMEVNMGGRRARYGGKIETFSPGKEFSFANDWIPNTGWKAPTFMTIRLTPALGGTLAELFHHGFEKVGDDFAGEHAGYEAGWGMLQLSSLKEVVEGRA
ncbi:MAG: SRPBCC domain-containing protein [Proteobacteria bacterium]|nr:SRPBCC domain-containing protein [Pseudomonadota bacterium]